MSTTCAKTQAPKYGNSSISFVGFGTQRKGMVSRVGTPGPGAYEQKVHGKNAPRGVMCSRRPDSAPVKGRGTPGPGQYENSLSTKKAAPKYGMGTGVSRGRPNKDVLNTPGPNQYSPARNSSSQKYPSWVMGTDRRRPLSGNNANPGPGNYSPDNKRSAPAVNNHLSFIVWIWSKKLQ